MLPPLETVNLALPLEVAVELLLQCKRGARALVGSSSYKLCRRAAETLSSAIKSSAGDSAIPKPLQRGLSRRKDTQKTHRI